jgi:hypothetical protein
VNCLAAVELVDVIVIDDVDVDVIGRVIVAVHLNVNDTLIVIATRIVIRSRA